MYLAYLDLMLKMNMSQPATYCVLLRVSEYAPQDEYCYDFFEQTITSFSIAAMRSSEQQCQFHLQDYPAVRQKIIDQLIILRQAGWDTSYEISHFANDMPIVYRWLPQDKTVNSFFRTAIRNSTPFSSDLLREWFTRSTDSTSNAG